MIPGLREPAGPRGIRHGHPAPRKMGAKRSLGKDAAGVLVSDSRKLVFVHIQKTGGSTVDRLLRAHVEDLRGLGARHQFAIRGKKRLEAWDEYFKFAFVRNPWARLVSWHAMIRRAEKRGRRPQNKL